MSNVEKSLISIIIPVYNQAQELEQALFSIKNQTYKNIEIIIEEDKLHEGAPVMRNRGFTKAKGEYIIFWDADIVAVPQMLEIMKKCLDGNLKASFVYCDYKFPISNFSRQSTGSRISSGQFPINIKSQIFNIQKLKENNYIHSTSLIRRQAAIKWDESLKRFQDWDLWLTMAEQGKNGVYIPETLFTIISKGTMSSWLPKFAYKKPWKWLPGFREKVKKYEEAKKVVVQKHHLFT